MTRIAILATALAALVPSAIAAEGTPETKDTRCLFADLVDGFKNAEKETVVLTQGSREFLVTFTARCRGLNWAQEIATVARGGACLTPGDKIVFAETQGFTERCYIKTIEMVEKAKAAGSGS
jgi:hypothetical protein